MFFFLFFPKKSCCRFVSHEHISPGGCACFSSSLRTQESTSEGLNARRKQAQSKRASTCKPRDKSCRHACMQGLVVTQLKCHHGCARLAKSISITTNKGQILVQLLRTLVATLKQIFSDMPVIFEISSCTPK